jgi:hypothetical protein
VRLYAPRLGDQQRPRVGRRPAQPLGLGPQELDVGADDGILVRRQRLLEQPQRALVEPAKWYDRAASSSLWIRGTSSGVRCAAASNARPAAAGAARRRASTATASSSRATPSSGSSRARARC